MFQSNVWPWIDGYLATYISATLLVVLNALIVYKIVASRRAMQTSRNAGSSAGAANSELAATTIMLFVESASFMLLNLPFEVFWNTPSSLGILTRLNLLRCVQDIISIVAEFLSFLGSALNFILYMLSGRKFRKAFVDTLCRRPASSA